MNALITKVFPTNEGGEVIVTGYENAKRVHVKHTTPPYAEMVVEASQLRQGRVKNPYKPTVFGVGYIGQGDFKSHIAGGRSPAYAAWYSMMVRAYSQPYSIKNPSYADVSVHTDWHNFQVFAYWSHSQPYAQDTSFDLDKDLMDIGNKQYGPSACSFVPHAINSLFNRGPVGKYPQGVTRKGPKSFSARLNTARGRLSLGFFTSPEQASKVYIKAKKEYIKEVANKFKDQLHPRVYANLISWEY